MNRSSSALAPLDVALLRRLPLPDPDAASDKDARGRVLLVGGARQVPGAILLSAEAALRAGAGKLQVATVAALAPHLALAMPEALVMPLPESGTGDLSADAAAEVARRAANVDALLLGPGLLDADEAARLVDAVLNDLDGPAIVLDAAALGRLAQIPDAVRRHDGRVVITPHAGEMATLLGVPKDDIVADPLGAARRTADDLRAVVVMKGSETIIAAPGGEAWRFTGGCVGLATSGSGDVLAGLLTGLLARGAAPACAALHAVHLHGEAGCRLSRRIGPVGFLAREIAGEVPRIMAEIANGASG